MRIKIYLFNIIALIFLCAIESAGASETYKDYYVEYQKATATGDQTAIRENAKLAWQAAEKELGDHRLTAILAYNYGYEVLFTAPEEALSALTRVKALVDQQITEPPTNALDLYLVFAEFSVSKKKPFRLARALEKALVDFEKQHQDSIGVDTMSIGFC